MAKTKQMKNSAPYVQRALQDERVHEHVADAASRLRKAYRRAARQRGYKAVEDKKIYDHVRHAAGSARAAIGLMRRKPEPEPKRRGRKVVLAIAVGAGGVVVAKRRSGRTEPRDYADRPVQPVEPARHDHSSTAMPIAR
jgi:hypothetical protein